MASRVVPRPLERKLNTLQIIAIISLVAMSAISTDLYLSGLPDMMHSFSTTESAVQLTLAYFMIGFASGQIISGPLSDHYGRLPVLRVSLIIYVLASIACFLVSSIEMMWAARLVQGLAAAAGPVLARAMITDLYERQDAARLMSHLASAMAIVPALAPIFGSILLQWFNWPSHFIVLMAFGLILLFFVQFTLDETAPSSGGHALEKIKNIFLASLGFFKHKRFVGYVVIGSCAFGSMFAYISISSYLVTNTLGVDKTYFGYTFAVNVAGFFIAAYTNARILKYIRIERIVGLAMGMLLINALLFLFLQFNHLSLLVLLGSMFFVFATGGFCLANSQAEAIGLFRQQAGSASAIFGLIQTATAALTGALAGYFFAGSAFPLAMIMLICSVLGLIAWWFCLSDSAK